jgi:hypothetical protein
MAKMRHGDWWVRAAYLGLAGLMLASSGCLAAAAGTAGGAAALGYFYYKGEMDQKYHASVEDTFAATRAALADLRMPVIKEELKDGAGSIESRTTDNSKVHISFTTQQGKIPAEGSYALVGVRVGVFGDDPVSEKVLAQIGAHLTMPGMPPPAPAVPVPPSAPIRPLAATGLPPQPPPVALEPPLAK